MLERISYLVAIALAVGAPFLTALLTNRHQRKLKELELDNQKTLMRYEELKDAFSKFVDLEQSMKAVTPHTLNFVEAINAFYRFFPADKWPLLDACADDPKNTNNSEAVRLEAAKLLQELYQDIPTKYSKS